MDLDRHARHALHVACAHRSKCTKAQGDLCTAGAALTLGNSTYAAASWLAGYTATVRTAACTPTAPTVESFGSYIKASVMVVVAVLSVALF